MNKPTRTASVSLILLTAVTLAACGSKTSTAASGATSSAAGAPSTSGPETTASSSVASSNDTAAASSSSAASSSPESSSGTGAGGCAPKELKTKVAGKLTIATDDPAYDPWFAGNDPTSGKGYESAVAYAVAAQLGFAKTGVTWTRTKFNAAISPAPKDFDFDINEFSISADRKKAVDFSTGYYDVKQAIVTTKGSPIAKATTLAALKNARLGAQLGTTSLTALNAQIAPSTKATVFQTNDAAVQGLQSGQIDGIVTDLPTAAFMASGQVKNGALLGTLPVPATPEQFGLLLEKGSALTDCVSKAVDAVKAAGTLDKLAAQNLNSLSAPELK